MALHSYELGNLSVIYRVTSSVNDDWLCNRNVRTVFFLHINLNLVFRIYRVSVNFTDINFAIGYGFKRTSHSEELRRHLRSENAYRAEVPLYASMLTQAMDYDRILAGSRSHQTGVSGENNSVRLSIQGGHLGHDNNGGIARGATPESSGSYGFVRLEGDLLRTEVAGMSLTTGVYGAAGHSSVDVKDDDGSRAGTVRDDAGSLGGYLNLTHTSSGLWADIVAQGTRHSMKASSDNNDFRARGWGWLGSLETGLPFSITDNLMLEPQLQYTWQGLSLDDGQDNAG